MLENIIVMTDSSFVTWTVMVRVTLCTFHSQTMARGSSVQWRMTLTMSSPGTGPTGDTAVTPSSPVVKVTVNFK